MCHSRLKELITKRLIEHLEDKSRAFDQACLGVYLWGEPPKDSAKELSYEDALLWVLAHIERKELEKEEASSEAEEEVLQETSS